MKISDVVRGNDTTQPLALCCPKETGPAGLVLPHNTNKKSPFLRSPNAWPLFTLFACTSCPWMLKVLFSINMFLQGSLSPRLSWEARRGGRRTGALRRLYTLIQVFSEGNGIFMSFSDKILGMLLIVLGLPMLAFFPPSFF